MADGSDRRWIFVKSQCNNHFQRVYAVWVENKNCLGRGGRLYTKQHQSHQSERCSNDDGRMLILLHSDYILYQLIVTRQVLSVKISVAPMGAVCSVAAQGRRIQKKQWLSVVEITNSTVYCFLERVLSGMFKLYCDDYCLFSDSGLNYITAR